MRSLSLVLAAALAAGCGAHIRSATALQPNPARAFAGRGELPKSVPLYIFIHDSMDYVDPRKTNDSLTQENVLEGGVHIPRFWQLRSAARFAVVEPGMLRFQVAIVERDERDAKTAKWKVWLEDETGRKLEPDTRENAALDHLILPWSLNPGRLREKKRVLPGWDAYQGRAEYVFRAPRLMTPDRKLLRLVMQHDDVVMRFEWRFADGDDVEIHNYGWTRADSENGTLVAPDPDAEIAQTWSEAERR
jgi:hypothetical protein